MRRITKELITKCNYDEAVNRGKNEIKWDTTKEKALADLKNYFKKVADGPC